MLGGLFLDGRAHWFQSSRFDRHRDNQPPDRRNALTSEMMQKLLSVVGEIRRDHEVHCVILTATGLAFSAGGDIGAMRRNSPSQGGPPGLVETLPADAENSLGSKLLLALAQLEKPVIAAVNGPAAGLGFELSLVCDFRIASDRANFSEAFVRVGALRGRGCIFSRGWPAGAGRRSSSTPAGRWMRKKPLQSDWSTRWYRMGP